jgi:Ser/Thr protein kinase RdoA (MazF antagonist)
MPLQPAYSTIAADAIAGCVEAIYDTGPIAAGVLLNRGFNDAYELTGADGRRHFARLSGGRFRGPPNIAYETDFLAHLRRCGVPVAAAVPARDGTLWRELDAPEGPRAFALFDHVEGRTPVRTLWLTGELKPGVVDDIRLLGAGHAAIHAAGETYRGPASLYRLEANHLLRRPLAQVLAAPVADEALRAAFAELGAVLEARLAAAAPQLSTVACHGDNHGGNTFISRASGGAATAIWFDFDDAGPGYLAYDLAVFLWGLLRRVRTVALDQIGQTLWTAFLDGYRTVRLIPEADLAAIGLFVPIRQAWFLGEFVAHIPQWGTQNVSREWLKGELEMMRAWAGVETPATA